MMARCERTRGDDDAANAIVAHVGHECNGATRIDRNARRGEEFGARTRPIREAQRGAGERRYRTCERRKRTTKMEKNERKREKQRNKWKEGR